MNNKPFVLNSRFLVNPVIHNLRDNATGKEVRLEPRLMNVFCFLAANVNQLVSREQLIKEVWNNYGGADDGLNQAISFLRKLLDDPDKKIIETIPTKGYLLNATITDAFLAEEKVTNETSLIKDLPAEVKLNNSTAKIQKNNRKIIWVAALILIVIIAAVSYYFWPSGNDALPVLSVKPMPNIKMEVNPKLTNQPLPNLPPRDTLKPTNSIKR